MLGAAIPLALASALAAAAPNMFQDGPYAFTTIEVASEDLARDVRLFDEAARSAGFGVTMRNDRLDHDPKNDVTKRVYRNPARCCFQLNLERKTEAPVLSIFAFDMGEIASRFRPEECAVYARFRTALAARIDPARIVREEGLPCR